MLCQKEIYLQKLRKQSNIHIWMKCYKRKLGTLTANIYSHSKIDINYNDISYNFVYNARSQIACIYDQRWKKEMNSVSIIKTANYIPLKNKIISLLSLRLTKIIQFEIISNNGWSFENWSIIMSTFKERKKKMYF